MKSMSGSKVIEAAANDVKCHENGNTDMNSYIHNHEVANDMAIVC